MLKRYNEHNGVVCAVLLLAVVMTGILSGPAWAADVETISRQDLDAMIQADTGTVTLVSYWATWCSACRQEIPALNEIYDTYPRDQVRIIGVSFDKDPGQLDLFMKLAGFEYEIYRVPEEHAEGFKEIVALPTLVFYKKNGKKGWTHKGLMLPEQIRRTIAVFAREN
ncbi:TlpA family protein disulfide reductase [Desulfoplanes sp.]